MYDPQLQYTTFESQPEIWLVKTGVAYFNNIIALSLPYPVTSTEKEKKGALVVWPASLYNTGRATRVSDRAADSTSLFPRLIIPFVETFWLTQKN